MLFRFAALAVYFALAKPRISPFLHGGFAVLLLLAGFSLWDHRSPAQRMMEENRLPPELMRLIDQRQGEVFWMNGLAEPWFDLGRPQWASPLQGVPIIFSPVLAAEWRRRMQILMDLGLAAIPALIMRACTASADLGIIRMNQTTSLPVPPARSPSVQSASPRLCIGFVWRERGNHREMLRSALPSV